MSRTMQDFSPCSVFVRAPLLARALQMYRSNRSFNILPPPPPHQGIWLFWKFIVQILPYPSQNAFQSHIRVRSGDQICPLSGDISQAHEWQKDGKHAFICRTKSLYIQQIIRIQYNKNWEALLAYLLRAKHLVLCKNLTYWDYYIPYNYAIFMTISLTCIIAHLVNKHTFGRSKHR